MPLLCVFRQTESYKQNMDKFTELPLSAYLQEALAAAQFTVPTPVQGETIPHALLGKDVLATANTGTGKTLAFLLPIMEQMYKENPKGLLALVLVPTRELAMQVMEQYEMLRGKKLREGALVVGGLNERPQLKALKTANIIVATPGRLEDFINRRLVNLSATKVLVLDEADRMLDMGFVQAIRRIVSLLPKDRQTMCFSATIEQSVAHLINECMSKPVRVACGSTITPHENVHMQAFEVTQDNKRDALHQLLAGEPGRCLVFARTKRGTERLAKSLARDGVSATMIHGDRTQGQRSAALAGFQQGKFRVLVATDIAARGIHVDDIAHVINYDLPQLAEDFVHRVGRTARAGLKGVATTLYLSFEEIELRRLERSLKTKIQRRRMSDYNGGISAPRLSEAVDNTPSKIGRLPGEFLQRQTTV